MSSDPVTEFPRGTADERELLLRWLRYLRGAVTRKLEGLSDEQARWTPDGALISLLGIVNHLTQVEWRWIQGGMLGQQTWRTEAELAPGQSSPWRPPLPPIVTVRRPQTTSSGEHR